MDKEKLTEIIRETDLLITNLDINKPPFGSLERVTINNLLDFRQALLTSQTKDDVKIANSILIRFAVGEFDYDSNIYKELDEITEKTAKIADDKID